MGQSKAQIKAKLEGYIYEYNRKITMWKQVQIVTKKDGTEFQNFGKNFTNCKVVREWGDIFLEVTEWKADMTPHYINDRIRINQPKVGKLNDADMMDVSATYIYIQDTILKYETWVNEWIEQIGRLDAAYDYMEKTMAEVETKLEELCGGNRTSLYYALMDNIQRFPYCT